MTFGRFTRNRIGRRLYTTETRAIMAAMQFNATAAAQNRREDYELLASWHRRGPFCVLEIEERFYR